MLVLWEVPGTDHCGAASTAPQEFEHRLIDWFEGGGQSGERTVPSSFQIVTVVATSTQSDKPAADAPTTALPDTRQAAIPHARTSSMPTGKAKNQPTPMLSWCGITQAGRRKSMAPSTKNRVSIVSLASKPFRRRPLRTGPDLRKNAKPPDTGQRNHYGNEC
jgi:hypothetical protein